MLTIQSLKSQSVFVLIFKLKQDSKVDAILVSIAVTKMTVFVTRYLCMEGFNLLFK